MALNQTAPQLPNPFTPMAFLPPNIAFQVTVASYILVGTLGALIWDILSNIGKDFRLLFKHQISIPTIVFVLSRVGSLAYVLASTLFETAPTGNCQEFLKVVTGLYPVAVPATSLLFLFRLRAVYSGNKYVIAIFVFLWLGVLGACITVTRGVTAINIGITNYCLNFSLKDYVASAGIVPLINDSLIFFAISYRLIRNTHMDHTVKNGVRTLLFGEYLPAFSRGLLQDGQMYYVTTVTMNLLTVVMLYVPSVPVAYRTMFTVPNIALTNIMACRVFRATKLGIRDANANLSGTHNNTSSPNGHFVGAIPLALRHTHGTACDVTDGIDVTNTVEYSYDRYGKKNSQVEAR